MKPLIKINFKYFQRNLCSFILGYFLVPIISLIFSIIRLINKWIFPSFNNSLSINSKFLFKNSFTSLPSILKNTYIISENMEDGTKSQKFIYKETKINITTYSSESEIFNKTFNTLIMTNIDNKYNFIFSGLEKEKNYNSFLEYQSLISKFLISQKTRSITYKNISLIYSNKDNTNSSNSSDINHETIDILI